MSLYEENYGQFHFSYNELNRFLFLSKKNPIFINMLSAFTYSKEMYSLELILAMNAAKEKKLVTTIVEDEIFISRVYPKNNIFHQNEEWIDLMHIFIIEFMKFNKDPEEYQKQMEKEVEESSIPSDRLAFDLKRWLKKGNKGFFFSFYQILKIILDINLREYFIMLIEKEEFIC